MVGKFFDCYELNTMVFFFSFKVYAIRCASKLVGDFGLVDFISIKINPRTSPRIRKMSRMGRVVGMRFQTVVSAFSWW